MIHPKAHNQDGWAGNWSGREITFVSKVPLTAVLHIQEENVRRVHDNVLCLTHYYWITYCIIVFSHFYSFFYSELRHTHKVTHSHAQSRGIMWFQGTRERQQDIKWHENQEEKPTLKVFSPALCTLSWSRWSKNESWSWVSLYWLKNTH